LDLWWTEQQTPDQRLSLRIAQVLHRARSDHQEVAVYDTPQYGRLLTLDDVVMTTERDEFVYHEMLVHVPLSVHPAPRRVLIVGGGDGGAVRESLRHPGVESVVLAELDPAVVDACRRFLPLTAARLDDPRVELAFGDGAAYLARHEGEFDAVLVDAPDPIGPATGLFSAGFYRSAARALRRGGVFAAQTESPFFNGPLISRVQSDLRAAFDVARLYWAVVPSYPGGMWTFSFASLGPDPLAAEPRDVGDTRWWSPQIQRAAFVLPPFVAALADGRR
jgi:spermidine synthase